MGHREEDERRAQGETAGEDPEGPDGGTATTRANPIASKSTLAPLGAWARTG